MSDLEPEWVSSFRASLLELDEAVSLFRNGDPPTVDEACAAIVGLNRAKAELAMVYDGLALFVSEVMDENPEVSLPDGAKVEKKWSANRTGWRHKDLGAEVAHRIVDMSIDMDTGEVLSTPTEMISQVLDFMQPSYWRIKELQRIGVNADLYCEVGESKASIIVRKGSSS
jgi:hypothetical protein